VNSRFLGGFFRSFVLFANFLATTTTATTTSTSTKNRIRRYDKKFEKPQFVFCVSVAFCEKSTRVYSGELEAQFVSFFQKPMGINLKITEYQQNDIGQEEKQIGKKKVSLTAFSEETCFPEKRFV
jgi:hypothetical protein